VGGTAASQRPASVACVPAVRAGSATGSRRRLATTTVGGLALPVLREAWGSNVVCDDPPDLRGVGVDVAVFPPDTGEPGRCANSPPNPEYADRGQAGAVPELGRAVGQAAYFECGAVAHVDGGAPVRSLGRCRCGCGSRCVDRRTSREAGRASDPIRPLRRTPGLLRRIGGQGRRRAQGVWVIVTEEAASAGKDVLGGGTCLFVLAECAQDFGKVVGSVQRLSVVGAEGAPEAGKGRPRRGRGPARTRRAHAGHRRGAPPGQTTASWRRSPTSSSFAPLRRRLQGREPCDSVLHLELRLRLPASVPCRKLIYGALWR
jgi:hypothetical protein